MLRIAVARRSASAAASKTVNRWMASAAAATSKQKRALSKEQLQGGTKVDSSGPAETPTTPPPSSGSPPPSGGSNMLPIGLVGLAAVGGAAYYWNANAPSAVEDKPEQVQETPKDEEQSYQQKETVKGSVAEEQQKPAEDAPNRVSSIQIPDKMKNTLAPIIVPAPHPQEGNRVTTILSEKNVAEKPIDDASTTEKAVSLLQSSQTQEAAEALVKSHHTAWSSMDAAYFSDLDSLSISQLKARVVQLAAEIKDRTRWEAVRLKEFLAMKEKETENKFVEAMQKQRLEFEDLMAKRLREQELEYSDRMHKALEAKEASIQSVIDSALAVQKEEHEADLKAFEEVATAEIQSKLEDEYASKVNEFTEQVAQDLQQKVATLKALTEKLAHLESALNASQTSKEGSVVAHRLSAAALALAEKLETSQGAAAEVKALKTAAGADGVIATALATIPNAADSGVPTLSELQTRFNLVHKKSRQAALVPAGRSGLEGQLSGMLFAAVKYAPNPDEAAPEADKDSAEYILVRAQKHVQLGELVQAVDELDKLEGQTAFTVEDWKRDAMRRIAVNKALKVIKMECALLNESLVA